MATLRCDWTRGLISRLTIDHALAIEIVAVELCARVCFSAAGQLGKVKRDRADNTDLFKWPLNVTVHFLTGETLANVVASQSYSLQ